MPCCLAMVPVRSKLDISTKWYAVQVEDNAFTVEMPGIPDHRADQRRLGARHGLRAAFLQPRKRRQFLRGADRALSGRRRHAPAATRPAGGARWPRAEAREAASGSSTDWREIDGAAAVELTGALARRQRSCASSSLLKGRRFVSLAFLGPSVDRPRGRPFFPVAEDRRMTKPRIHILALGGTIATRPDSTGAMQMGLGADDLRRRRAVCSRTSPRSRPRRCRASAAIRCRSTRSTRSRPRSAALKADGVVVTQGTDTLEETSFLLDLLLDLDIPVIVTAAMRNPSLTSPDGPGNLLAAVRVAADAWVRSTRQGAGRDRGDARRGLCRGRRAQGPSDAAQRLRLDPDRAARRAGRGPDRAARAAGARRRRRGAQEACAASSGKAAPVALFWMSLDDDAALMPMMLAASDRARLSRRGDRRDGRRPYARARGRERRPPRQGDADRDRRRAPAAGRCCARPMAGRARRSRCARPA